MGSENIYCWKCGERLPKDSVFCSRCGTRLDDEDEIKKEMSCRNIFTISDMLYFCHKHKRIIYAFIVVSIIFNMFFMPWKREFTNQGKKNLYKDDQYEYGTAFYKPDKFCDGYSSQDYGLGKYYGTYIGYDYKRIFIHEIGLLVIFIIGGKIYYLKK